MSDNKSLQHNIAAFLDISIEHAMDIYLDQASNTPDVAEEFEKYLSRLKVCLGQVDILLKLGFTCSKNNIFDFSVSDTSSENPHHIHFIKALEDLHKRNQKQIAEQPDTMKESEHDPTTSH